ncbi:MAG TPA: MMPL family transporter [Acidimicrobiales bacterium]|nr:MMPL family transporter [Acidimicrobiales bacterium]
MTLRLYRLGRACVRRRRLVLGLWALLAATVIALAQVAGGETSDAFDIPGVESQQALDVLTDDFPAAAGTSAQVVFAAEVGTLADPGAAAAVDAALAEVAEHPDVGAVGDLQRSPDGTIGYVDVQYDRPSEEIRDAAHARLEATQAATNASGAVRMELGGDLPTEAANEEPSGQEVIGVAVAVVVLLVAFGSVIAMGLPIGLALVGLATSMSLIGLVAAATDVISVAPVLAAMIGLGVGIDYALFIVTRHREHLRAGMTVDEAAGRAVATAGSAVLFAGVTVVIAICGLAIAGIPAVTVMGLMAGLAVAVMVALALTLLPALLGFAGRRIDAIRLPGMRAGAGTPGHESLWHRWGRQVAAHPWRYLTAGALALGLLAAPVAAMRLGMTDNGVSPTSMTTRRAYDLLAEGFGPGFNGPLVLSARLDGAAGATVDGLEPLAAAVADDPGVAAVGPAQPNDDGSAAVLRVIPTTAPQDERTTDLVHRLRDDVIPPALADVPGAEVYVGGQTATFIDMSDKVTSRLPWFVGAVIGLSVVLLTLVFRSIAVPLKAAAMNLLSIGAAYGVIVAVFQWGWLKGLFGVETTVPVVSFMPMILFAVLFGLSMDYEVFLLSRVREEYLHRGDNDAAVVEGISATARVITSAALIMISVFGAFVLGDDPIVKMFGVGLATAVLLDATIVRIVLVPATMKLLGERNWWLPGWLDRLLPDVDIEGGAGLPEPEYEPTVVRVIDADPEPALESA